MLAAWNKRPQCNTCKTRNHRSLDCPKSKGKEELVNYDDDDDDDDDDVGDSKGSESDDSDFEDLSSSLSSSSLELLDVEEIVIDLEKEDDDDDDDDFDADDVVPLTKKKSRQQMNKKSSARKKNKAASYIEEEQEEEDQEPRRKKIQARVDNKIIPRLQTLQGLMRTGHIETMVPGTFARLSFDPLGNAALLGTMSNPYFPPGFKHPQVEIEEPAKKKHVQPEQQAMVEEVPEELMPPQRFELNLFDEIEAHCDER